MSCYVYRFLHPLTLETYYVGQSCCSLSGYRRAFRHAGAKSKNTGDKETVKIYKATGMQRLVEIIQTNIDKNEIIGRESRYIRKYNIREYGGTLVNRASEFHAYNGGNAKFHDDEHFDNSEINPDINVVVDGEILLTGIPLHLSRYNLSIYPRLPISKTLYPNLQISD